MDSEIKEQYLQLRRDNIVTSDIQAARAMNISPTRLSQYLNGSYSGDVKETGLIIKRFIDITLERKKIDSPVKFVKTRNAIRVLSAAKLTHIQKTIGLITGGAGLGKTMALQNYASENTDVIYIEADTAYSARELMSEIHRRLGLNGKGMLNPLKNSIIDKLKGSGRMIIIDQAEYLPVKALDLIRTIHDKADIGILFAGLPQLTMNIRGTGGVNEQLSTRIGVVIDIDKLSSDDILLIAKSSITERGSICEEYIIPCNGNARTLRMLMRESIRIADFKKTSINKEIISIAKNQML